MISGNEKVENTQVGQSWLHIMMMSLAILFFLQGARELIGTIYNFNLATMSINISIVAIFAFMSPIIYPLALKRLNQKYALLISGIIIIISRAIMSLGPDAEIYLAAAFVLVSAALIFLVTMSNNIPEGYCLSKIGQILIYSSILAVSLDIAFRAAGGSFDVSIYGFTEFRSISILIIGPVIGLFLYCLMQYSKELKTGHPMKLKPATPIFGLNLGLLLFIYVTFSGYPNVSAGWTSQHPLFSYIVTGLSLSLFLLLMLLPEGQKLLQKLSTLLVSEIMLAITFMLLLFEPSRSISAILLPASIFPLGIIFSHIIKFKHIENGKNDTWLSIFLAGFGFMILVFISVLTLTWAHVPGTAFLKDKMGLLALIAVLGIVFLTNMIYYYTKGTRQTPLPDIQKIPAIIIVLALLCTCILPLASSDMFRPISEGGTGTITVMTYNIHQGYGMNGFLDPWEILDTIQEVNPDILVLQESETNRLSSMNVDILNWLACKLEMHVYSGPSAGEQIYGLALLSKYEILDSELYWLESIEDQRVWFRCQVQVGAENVAVYGIHMGLSAEDRTSQSNEVIQRLANETMPFIMMGDFNTWPNETIYENLTTVMNDAWILAGHELNGPSTYTFDSVTPYGRIDYIFVSDELAPGVNSCEVMVGQLGSDHLPVWAVLDIG